MIVTGRRGHGGPPAGAAGSGGYTLRMRSALPGSRLPWLAGGGLVALLVVLAALQVRWLGEVAQADRQRLDAGARTALAALAADFDREVSRAWLTFLPPFGGGGASPPELEERWTAWRGSAPAPELVAALVLVEPGAPPLRFAGDGWVADAGAVPPRLLAPATERDRGGRPGPRPPRRRLAPLRAELPGLVLPLGRGGDERGEGRSPGRLLVVLFDRAFIDGTLLPALVDRHLVPVLGPDLEARVQERGGGATVFATAPALGGAFEWQEPIFALLPSEELHRLAFATGLPGPAPGLRRPDGEPRWGGRRLAALASALGGPAAWVLEVRPAGGSLDAALARAHRGNAVVALGILGVLGAAALALAVSARRARETARRQLEFTAAVSHELRTPLAAIRSLADNLADGVVRDPAQTRLYGAQIARQGERLTVMVEQVLALSAQEAGRPRPRETVDLASLAREVGAEATAGLPAARVEVEVPAEAPTVAGDPLALRRALQNLVANALKHGGTPPWAAVRLAVAAGDGEVRVEVADRGPGIPAGERERLFEAFYRGERAQAAQVPGTGLGLYLVRRIAEAHGGRVEVRSEPGAGSAFVLVLPRTGEAAP
jgi:signal transduction histidine kinase